MGLPPWMDGGREQYMLGTGQWRTAGGSVSEGTASDAAAAEAQAIARARAAADAKARERPESFEELVERVKREELLEAESRAEVQSTAHRVVDQKQQTELEVWRLASTVRNLLVDRGVAADARVIVPHARARYHEMIRSGRRRDIARAGRLAEKSALPAWNMNAEMVLVSKNDRYGTDRTSVSLYLGDDANVHTLQGMSDAQRRRGILIGGGFEQGAEFWTLDNALEARRGLASLVARHQLM